MCAELAALRRVEPAFEQSAEDGRVDLRPVTPCCLKQIADIIASQRECVVIVEQTAVEPVDGFEPDRTAVCHRAEQHFGIGPEIRRVRPAAFQHPREQILVWMRMRSISDTINSGGFSRATLYCRSCEKAASRFLRLPLYSQAKQPLRQTSAQPSPPLVLLAPFSKVNQCRSGQRKSDRLPRAGRIDH